MVDDLGETEFEDLNEFELKNREKMYGPYSIMVPSDEWVPEAVEPFKSKTTKWNPDEEALAYALNKVGSQINESSLRLASLEEAALQSPHDTWKGLPLCTSSEAAIPAYIQLAYGINSIEDLMRLAFVQGWRGTPQGLEEITKPRLLWMGSNVEGYLGATMTIPMLKVKRVQPGYSGWGSQEDVDIAITELLSSAQGRTVYSGDFDGYDASMPAEFMYCIRDMWTKWFIPSAADRIHMLFEYMIHAPLIYPYTLWDEHDGGVPSGTNPTGQLGTDTNKVAYHYVAKRAGTEIRRHEGLGDDAVYVFEEDVSVEDQASYLSELGLQANPEKQWQSTDACHYLQNWHSLRYTNAVGTAVGVRPIHRVTGGIISYERPKDPKLFTKWVAAGAVVAKLENARHHPLIKEYTSLVRSNDQVLQSGVKIRTILNRAGGGREIRRFMGDEGWTHNRPDPTKMADFTVAGILDSMSG
jgi:hypothetical protein